MNAIIAWWARNPVAANLLMAGILISGVLSFLSMEREVWPTIRVNWVQIAVPWPGAAPQEVEEQIVIRVEEALNDLDNIERLNSTASEGLAEIYVEANPKVDIADFINDVKLRVDSISSFPRDIEQPMVREIFNRDELIRVAVHGDVGEKLLTRTAQDIRDEIALLPGASIVELFGNRREEVSIEISEENMRRYGLTFDEIAAAIRGSSINLSSGTVRTETGDVQLRARNMADSKVDFDKIVLRQTTDGGVIYLGDVAQVKDGFEDIDMKATLNGEPAVLVQVMTGEKMNVVKTSEAVKAWLAEAKDRMPEGVKLTMWFDQSKTYFDRMETISSSAFYGLLLVFIVLLLTLRPKVAIWVTLGIATAFAGAFTLLPAYGVSLNMLSLFAFLLVLGVVVDDAIVVGENIHSEGQRTGGGIDAAILGTQLVAKPVIYAVLTTMIAFIPWLFLSGVEVQFTRQISIIIIAALSFSLIEALFILPSHLAKMKPRPHMGRFGRAQKKIADSITNFAETYYQPAARTMVKHRYLTASLFAFCFLVSIGFVSSGILKFSFMPDVENEMIAVNVTLADGTPISRSRQILNQLQSAEKQLERESAALAAQNGDDGRLIENWYTRSRNESVLALVQLAPPETRNMSAKQAADRLRELVGDIPDAEEVTVSYTINEHEPAIEISVNAADLDELRQAADALKEKLRSYDAVYDVRDSLHSSTDEMRLIMKPGAEKLGLSLADVSRQVRQAYYGEEVQRLPRDGTDVRVMLRYPETSRRSLDSLADFRVRTMDGREVPLMAIADIEVAPGIKKIERRERQRSTVVSAEVKNDLRNDVMNDLNANFFPEWHKKFPTVTRGNVGQVNHEAKFLQEMLSLYVVAAFLMYGLIAIAFRSYWLPLLIMTAIPFGFMGAVYGHLLYGVPMALFSYFGIGAAAGVVVNDNLVLVDYILKLRSEGMNAYKSVVEAGVARFRPILLTSLTTFIGLMPMMLERSTQAQFLKPTVIALAFGVLFATLVTLFLVPALYSIGEDIMRSLRNAKARLLGRKPQPADMQEARGLAPGE